MSIKSGVLITNLGTPDEATPSALRRYLAEFLWDERVVDLARLPWWLILHGIILRTRPAKVAKAYQKVWTTEGGPLLVISKQQRDAIEKKLQERIGKAVPVALGMRYGNPSIPSAMEQLRGQGVERIIVLPLFPQYSAATTGSTFDAVSEVLQGWRSIPELTFINQYHDHPAYLGALAHTIQEAWAEREPAERLLLSFHGLPVRYQQLGDPYRDQCEATALGVAEQLVLNEGQLQVVFQSRFGKEEWLQPYTDKTLENLPKEGIDHVDILCPGFSADCVETLEEIAIQNQELFIDAGGEALNYIPALNSREDHIEALTEIILERW
ncbi:MAG: ferrochelatase [Gammaproteobacteria bacterium]|jgi:ferrochelatase|nr:ferrochelatase [Gammaproteobacteria bacterium]MBT4810811.1 ferrochelatase [Thiotrichales bacterium]MBT3473376.1 ferrochelatase [Gammaproteobacteria bacterium]MBT3967433.1 ferrochelatase [Gammaproteobacteria bacterium]MBT4329285.1 ferrochelatase [Gammaproteobacteria bacterium]